MRTILRMIIISSLRFRATSSPLISRVESHWSNSNYSCFLTVISQQQEKKKRNFSAPKIPICRSQIIVSDSSMLVILLFGFPLFFFPIFNFKFPQQNLQYNIRVNRGSVSFLFIALSVGCSRLHFFAAENARAPWRKCRYSANVSRMRAAHRQRRSSTTWTYSE